jgi:leucyl aminopeptidase
MPPNVLNSENFADEVKKDFSKIENVKCRILKRVDIEKLGMGLFLSVNKGSMHEPRLVVLEYKGNPKSKDISALVGKGIMYDSGGYNIKTGGHMKGMKMDMSGAAGVIGAMKAISQLKPKANFVVVAPLTDNRVNGDASMPDMIYKSMNGKTVEVNNTDAEGRLVLADAMTYAIREAKATNITTIATLTGAVLVALGETFTGA